jgi:hypothetical protein
VTWILANGKNAPIPIPISIFVLELVGIDASLANGICLIQTVSNE